MNDIERIRRGLQEVVGAVGLARRKVADGQLVDLSGLEARVDELCRSILALDRAAAQPLHPTLLGLIDDLNRLSEQLRAQHRQVATELQGKRSHGEAAAAYRKPRR